MEKLKGKLLGFLESLDSSLEVALEIVIGGLTGAVLVYMVARVFNVLPY